MKATLICKAHKPEAEVKCEVNVKVMRNSPSSQKPQVLGLNNLLSYRSTRAASSYRGSRGSIGFVH